MLFGHPLLTWGASNATAYWNDGQVTSPIDNLIW